MQKCCINLTLVYDLVKMAAWIFFIFSFAFATDKVSSHSLRFENLKDFGHFETSSLAPKPSLWYFFQPECPSCARQSQALSCLAPETPILALGVFSSKQKLLKTARRHKLKGLWLWAKAYESHIQQTPTLWIVGSKGEILQTYSHFVPCEVLAQKLKP